MQSELQQGRKAVDDVRKQAFRCRGRRQWKLARRDRFGARPDWLSRLEQDGKAENVRGQKAMSMSMRGGEREGGRDPCQRVLGYLARPNSTIWINTATQDLGLRNPTSSVRKVHSCVSIGCFW
jgi:hypothetical protein